MKHAALLKRISAVGVSAACCVALVGCAGTNYGYTGGIAATVNGVEIEEDTITKYIQDYRTSAELTSDEDWGTWLADCSYEPSTVREQVIDYYVEQELVNQACEEYGVTVDESTVDEQIETMKANFESDEAWESALSSNGITEEEYREAIEQGLKEQGLQEKVVTDSTASDEDVLEMLNTYSSMFDGGKRSSHILFSSDDEETAQQVLDQINAGEISFADAAAQYSTDTASASNGGDVGWDVTNSFVDEYTTALESLEVGQVSGLVTSDYGIHIITVTDEYTAPEEDATELSEFPDEFVEYIRSVVESNNQSTAYSEWFDSYKEQADIQINDMPENVPYNIDMTQYETDTTEDESTDSTSTDSSESTESEESSDSDDSSSESSESDTGESSGN